MFDRPPCWPDGAPCPNPCAGSHYDQLIHARIDLRGPWTGWRLRGRVLVSPDRDRITPERLRGILWREHLERKSARCAPSNGLVLPFSFQPQPPQRG